MSDKIKKDLDSDIGDSEFAEMLSEKSLADAAKALEEGKQTHIGVDMDTSKGQDEEAEEINKKIDEKEGDNDEDEDEDEDETEDEDNEEDEEESEDEDEESEEKDGKDDVLSNLVAKVKKTDKGLVFPKDMSDAEKLAATAEIRRRDTQAQLTKIGQEKKNLEAALKEVKGNIKTSITKEQQKELDKIPLTDRNKYAETYHKFIEENKKAADTFITEKMTLAEKQAVADARNKFVEEFNSGRKIPITKELLESGKVPLESWYAMEKGKISFEEAIRRIAKFVDTKKKTKSGASIPTEPDLTSSSGSGKRPKQAEKETIEQAYARAFS